MQKLKPFTFQLISDVHLEMHNARKTNEFIARKDKDMQEAWRRTMRGQCMDEERLNQVIAKLLVPCADYLIVAGDLCDFTTFAYLSKQAKSEVSACYADTLMQFFAFYRTKFKKIFYVLGNHEFYRTSVGLKGTLYLYKKRIAELNEQANSDNVILLERSHCVLEEEGAKLHVLGTTLWSDIDERASRFVNDYTKIRMLEERITYEDTLARFKKNEQWLKTTLQGISEDEQIVVVTHHLPSYDLIHPRYADSPCNAAFASDFNYLMDKPNVQAWFYGHTHSSMTKKIGNCTCYCNPCGYPEGEKGGENEEYSPSFKVEIIQNNHK